MSQQLLFLTTSFPAYSGDIGGGFVAAMAEDLVHRGYGVRVLAPPGAWSPPGVVRRVYRAPGGVLSGGGAPEALARGALGTYLSAGLTTLSMVQAACRAARADDVIVAHWLVPCGLAALAAGRRRGAAVHLIAHGSDVALLERLPCGVALARALDRAAGVTFVSEDLRQRFCALLGRPAQAPQVVIPMGVCPPRPDAVYAQRLRERAGGRAIIATVGRLAPIKGLEVLAQALARRADVVWFAAGSGPSAESLDALAASLDVPLVRLGALAPPQRDALLQVADVFALPSCPMGRRQEGTPVSLMEAQTVGLVTVASDLPGVRALRPTALVPAGDVGALRAALGWALRTRPVRAPVDRYLWAQVGQAHARAISRARR